MHLETFILQFKLKTIFSDTLKIVNDSYLNMQCFFWFYIHTRHIHISYLDNSTYSGVKKPIVYIDWLWSEFYCTYLHSYWSMKLVRFCLHTPDTFSILLEIDFLCQEGLFVWIRHSFYVKEEESATTNCIYYKQNFTHYFWSYA